MLKIKEILLSFKPLLDNHIFRFLVGIPLTACAFQLSEYFNEKNLFFFDKLFSSAGVLCAYYLIILSFLNQMFDRVYSFHTERNFDNTHRNPVKFAIKHRHTIHAIYKYFFITAIILFLIKIWI